MPPQGHFHIIAAGENLPAVFAASLRDYPKITRAYVFTDTTVFYKHADPAIEKGRMAERNAISAAKNTATALGIPFHDEVISAPAYTSARDALTRIRREHPGARYTFDIAGGSPALGMLSTVRKTSRIGSGSLICFGGDVCFSSVIAITQNINYCFINLLCVKRK